MVEIHEFCFVSPYIVSVLSLPIESTGKYCALREQATIELVCATTNGALPKIGQHPGVFCYIASHLENIITFILCYRLCSSCHKYQIH